MDSRGQPSTNLVKKARSLHKLGDRAVGSVIDADRLNECAFLASVRRMTIDIENVDEYLKTPLSKEKPTVVFRVLSGGDDVGDLQQPTSRVRIRGKLKWIGGKVEFVRFGGDEAAESNNSKKILFTVGFPKDKSLIVEANGRQILPMGKMKHQGVQIFRINQPLISTSDHSEKDVTKTGLEVTKVSDLGEVSTAPYLKLAPKQSLFIKLMSAAGMAFDKTAFHCYYMGSQKVASIRPIVGLVQNRIGYDVQFAGSLPHPEHQSKAVILALTTMLLMRIAPVDVEKFCDVQA